MLNKNPTVDHKSELVAKGFRIRTSKKVASEYLSEYQSTLPEPNMAFEQMLYKRCLGRQDTVPGRLVTFPVRALLSSPDVFLPEGNPLPCAKR